MKITLCRNDILQAATQVKQIRKIKSLEFNRNNVVCVLTLNNEAVGIFGVPENWIVNLTFSHSNGTVTADLDINSGARPVGGNLKLAGMINNATQAILNGMINLAKLEKRLLNAIKLPDFASSNGKSITVDLNMLLWEKLNAAININNLECGNDSISIDLSIEFEK